MTQPIIHDEQSDHPAVRTYVDILRRNLPDATYLDGRATALIAGIAAIPHQTDAELRQSLTAALTALELVRDLLRHPPVAPVHYLEADAAGDDDDLMACGLVFREAVKTGSYTGVSAKVTCPGCRPTADAWAE